MASIPLHSWHPVAVHLPLIAFALAVLLDMLDIRKVDSRHRRAATLLWWLALAGAAGAVATGLWAYGRVEHSDSAHEVMTLHRNLALGVIAMLIVAALLRWRRPGSLLGALLGIAGVLGLGGVGYLGGELVFQHALGVETQRLQAIVRERGTEEEAPEARLDTAGPPDSSAERHSHTHKHSHDSGSAKP